MKRCIPLSFSGLLIISSLGALKASAELEISASVQIHAKTQFEAPLGAFGTWVEVGSYGRCWRPVGVAVQWRPYCSGQWVWTDCGWYWSSDEPWAWACYHYGAWVYDGSYGWIWVPGIEWAPAWVSWRVGGGFIGWAPLGPPGLIVTAHASADRFVFIGAAHFNDVHRPSSVIVKDTRVFSQTSEIGGVRRQTLSIAGAGPQRVMVNHGPGTELIQKATGKPLRLVSISEAVRRTGGPSEIKNAAGPKSKKEHHDTAGWESDRPGRDESAWSPAGPGNSHGNGGGGHGRGRP